MKDYNEFWSEIRNSYNLHPSVRFRNSFIIKVVRGLSSNLKNKTILDVGCGNGDLLLQLSKNLNLNGNGSILLSGCDVSEYQIKKNIINKLPFDFWVADLNKDIACRNKFNVIICSEVIEHLEDWKSALQHIEKINITGGYLILTTQSGRIFKSDALIGHLQHFELDCLKDYIKKLNYNIIIAEKRGFPFYNLQKVMFSAFSSISRDIAHSDVNMCTSILFSITYFLFRISLKSKKIGPQIFIVANKL